MEKVQFQLEATLPELKDLESLHLFTKPELRQITLRRTKFESSLIRRMARKSDFFEYADYEITLEKLRRTRWKRLGYDKTPPPKSVSSHSIQRRVVYILRRATDRFPHDLGVWMAYVDYARGEGMSKVVGSGLTSALQLHPLASVLYILLSQHYLSPLTPPKATAQNTTSAPLTTTFSISSVSPARKTLLIGLRLLPTDQTLWREYIRLEIGWVEALRRRWRVLGLGGHADQGVVDTAGKGKGKAQVEGMDKLDGDIEMGLPDAGEDDLPDLGLNAFGASGETARKAIMRGDLVLTVLRSSFSNPMLGSSLGYHRSLLNMFRDYPTGLRGKLLEAVYENMDTNEILKNNVVARRMSAERGLYDRTYTPEEESIAWPLNFTWIREDGEDVPVETGSDLLAELGNVIGKMKGWKPELESVVDAWREEIGLWLCKWMSRMEEDVAVAYLAGELKPFLKSEGRPSAKLLTCYTTGLSNLLETNPSCSILSTPTKLEIQLRSFTAIHPTSSALWAARIALEEELTWSDEQRQAQLSQSYIEAMNTLGATSGAAEIWEDAMEFFDEALYRADEKPCPQEGMRPYWVHALSAARRYTQESIYSRTDSEELYSRLLAVWASSRLDRFEDEQETLKITVLESVLNEILTSGRWGAPAGLYSSFFDSVAGFSLRPENAQHRLRRVFTAWTAKGSVAEANVSAVLAWARWLVLSGSAGGAEAWKAVEILQKRLETEGEASQAYLMRLKAGWTDILAAAEMRSQDSDGEEDAADDVSME